MTKKRISNRKLIYYICVIAIFASLEFVITSYISVPIGGGAGYLNFSDLFVFLLACFVNPIVGGLAGGISGMYADLFLGYATFAPFTLIIKFLEGLVSGYLYNLLVRNQKNNILKIIFTFLSFIIGGVLMALLYTTPDFITYGTSDLSSSLPIVWLDLGFNCLQGVINACIASCLIISLDKTNVFKFIETL